MRNPRLVLFLTIFVAMLGLSVLFPVLAPLARELGLSPAQVGAFSTAYSLLQFLCAPFWGARSERVGRKPVLITGLLGFSLSFALFGVFALLGARGAISGTTRGLCGATALAIAAIWSGVVPQQPPTMLTRPAAANSPISRAM